RQCSANEGRSKEQFMHDRLHFLMLNIGHYLDHLFTLIFATVAALVLYREWGLGYADLLKYATPGFFAFGAFALPAGWLADKWSREGMMATFFIGIGLASLATSFSRTPLEIGLGLFAIGLFAAIYHPVGFAIVVETWKNTGMRIAVNGVVGNLGVASAALITGYFIDHGGWRMAFIVPGVVSILIGVAYTALTWRQITAARAKVKVGATPHGRAGGGEGPAVACIDDRVSHHGGVQQRLPVHHLCLAEGVRRAPFRHQRIGHRARGTDVPGVHTRLNGAAGRRSFPRPARAAHRVHRRGGSAGRVLRHHAGARRLGALASAMAFMLAAFGQIPINDFMIGRLAEGEWRGRPSGAAPVVGLPPFASTLPPLPLRFPDLGFYPPLRRPALVAR